MAIKETNVNQVGGYINDSIKPLVTKLENFQTHSSEDIKCLEDAVSKEKSFGKDEDVIREGDKPQHVYLVVKGWACRYRLNDKGKMQILNYLIAGDFCNLYTTLTGEIEYSIGSLVPSVIAYFPHDGIEAIYDRHSYLARSFNWLALNEISILQEWLINLGSRPSHQRLAHLLCELLIRARAAGLTEDHRFHLPLTQPQLGEAMGITHTHTNRAMKRLRDEGMMTFENKILHITDWPKIKTYADFNARYLHLDHADPSLLSDL